MRCIGTGYEDHGRRIVYYGIHNEYNWWFRLSKVVFYSKNTDSFLGVLLVYTLTKKHGNILEAISFLLGLYGTIKRKDEFEQISMLRKTVQ